MWKQLAYESFQCIHSKMEYDEAVKKAMKGLELMEKEYGKACCPEYETYTRLLLNAGEGNYHLGNLKEAATYLKRAAATVNRIKYPKTNDKKTLRLTIKKCRSLNNRKIAEQRR